MNTSNHEAIMLLALDALVFADRISTEWPEEKQLRHLREQIALARKHLESDPTQTMRLAQREIETLRACKDAEMRWEILMMRLVGEDGLGSVEQAISALKTERDQLKAQVTSLIAIVGEEIDNRDNREAHADRLADGIANALGIEIGEHSSANCPWDNAYLAIQEFDLTEHDAEVIEKVATELKEDFPHHTGVYFWLIGWRNELRQKAQEAG